jgi:hypothetical protein
MTTLNLELTTCAMISMVLLFDAVTLVDVDYCERRRDSGEKLFLLPT